MVTTPAACDHLAIDLIRRRLDTTVVGRHMYLFESVTSTNDALRHFARAGAEEGTVVLAEQQTAGRRHGGLPWFSPPGVNLYASVLFRPALMARDVPLFALIASLALADVARTEGARAATRWPNDVVIDGRKVGGALVEYATVGDRVTHVILGVGINLNVDEADLRAALDEAATGATTLTRALGRAVDRNRFAARLLGALESRLLLYVERGPAAVREAWLAADGVGGAPVEVTTGAGRLQGCIRGVDADGCLVIDAAGGVTHRVAAGTVRPLA
jgi:BirA family transcriptional regulator, biotin operon repressor / biotin---[acetyl-CoA-carboxylase] ligase